MLSVGVLSFTSCNKKEKKEAEKIYNKIESKIDCLADPSWFPHSQTPAPLEGKNSPFNNGKTVTNLDFHRWSWQKFLWLTKPASPTDNTPLFLNNGNFIQTDDTMIELEVPSGVAVNLIYEEQACSNGILKTNPQYNSENAKAETVLYSLHTNSTMFVAANGFIKKFKSGEVDIKKNYETFPIGSLELKVSWIVTDAIPVADRKNYYTTQGSISLNGAKPVQKEVALLGVHVVGIVENHPEFIWATFQHNDIAPFYDWKTQTASSQPEKLLFKAGSVSDIGGIQWIGKDKKTKTPGYVTTPSAVYDLFQYGVPRNVGGSFMKTSQSEPTNFNNIKDINTCVHKHLKDVWSNYFYNGSIWLNTEDYTTTLAQAQKIVELGDNIASAQPGALTRGSLNCANTSMETFTQTFLDSLSKIKVDNLANCFSCHGAKDFATSNQSPLYLSHLFNGLVHLEGGKTREEINLLKDKEHVLKVVESLNK